MPVTTDTLHNLKRCNRWFAVSAALALAASGWMLWHDFDRPWRHIQRNFFNLRSAMAHLDVLGYQSPKEQEKRKKLADALDHAEHELKAPENKAREKDLLDKQKLFTGQAQGVALSFGNRNAELQVKAFNYEEAKTLNGERDPRTIAIKADYDASAKELAELKAQSDKLEDTLRDLKSQVKQFYSKRNEAQKALAAYDKGRNDAERLDTMYGPGFKRTVFNIPGLDYLAPKGVPGREEVDQIFTKSIRFNYNFLDSYVTDRCMTCHTGIDNPALTIDAFAKKTEAGLSTEKVGKIVREENEKLARVLPKRLADADVDEFTRGDKKLDADAKGKFVGRIVGAANEYLREIKRPPIDAATVLKAFPDNREMTRGAVNDEVDKNFRMILAAAPPMAPDGKTPLKYEDMSQAQRMAHVASLTAAMNLYLAREGRPPIDFKKELRSHPRLDLYVSPTSAHPIKTMGCTVCHEGDGQETDFVLAAHTPKNHHEEEDWKKEYYVRELKIPLATFELVEDYWERPMLLPGYTSASCRKCHTQTFDLERSKTQKVASAQRVVEGRDLFTQVGCINCHAVEGLNDSRRVGTDLSHVAYKLSQGFMEHWVDYPKNFRASTWMPSFFHQENNLPSSANEFDPQPVVRTESEVQAIVYYLRTFSKPYDPKPVPEGIAGDPKHGEELFTSIGCLACHANLDAKDPMDSEGKSIGERWITAELVQHDGLKPEDAKKRFEEMSKADRVRYAMRTFTPKRREDAMKAARAEELAADRESREPDPKKMYVPPQFTRVAPELSGIGTKLVNDPADAKQVAAGTLWLYNWLREPRHYSSYTRMPRMFRDNYYQYDDEATQRKKNDQDMLDVAAYLLTLRNDQFETKPLQDDSLHQDEMRRMILDLLGGQNTEATSQKILNDEKNSPDDPYGRLTSAVVAQVYKSYGDGDEAKRKVASVIAEHAPNLLDRQRLYFGMKMISHYGCYACHQIAGFEDAVRPGTELTTWTDKFMSQLDFAFYSPPFEHDVKSQPDVFGHLYPESAEYEHLVRDVGENPLQEILHNHASFAYHKLRNPRIWDRKKIKKPYEKLKMPNFSFTEEEARSLATYILSLKQANVTKDVQIPYEKTPAGKIARGRALVRDLNCFGCHRIEYNKEVEGDEPNIHQYYSTDTNLADTDPHSIRFKPPLLWGEGAKVQFDWLFTFLNNVEMLRPWLKARMPSFALTKEQTTTLVEYFAGLAQDESRVLRGTLDPVLKRIEEVHGAGKTEPSTDNAPSAWFVDPKYESQATYLKTYSKAKEQTGPFDWQVAATDTPIELASKLVKPYDKTVNRAGFLANVFNIEFPFTDPQKHTSDDARFKNGEEFFYNLKCLACHVGGDPKAPGTTTDIKAPNFALTFKRLRYDWVINWLQDPQSIQPGANMPQIFQGGSAFASLPPDQRDPMETKFGKTVEDQSHLLVDFLFSLGARNYTAIQPGGAQPAAPAAGEQAKPVEFDFEAGGDQKPAASQPAAGQPAPTSQPAKSELDF